MHTGTRLQHLIVHPNRTPYSDLRTWHSSHQLCIVHDKSPRKNRSNRSVRASPAHPTRADSNPFQPVPVSRPNGNNNNDSHNSKARAARRATKLKKTKQTASAAKKRTSPPAKPPRRYRPPSDGDMAEARRAHMTVCASCEVTPSLDEVVGLCKECPRTFCSGCLGSQLKPGTEDNSHGSAFLPFHSDVRNGESAANLELPIRKCSSCASGSDIGFPPPPPGVSPKSHLLEELLKHRLSWCFRAPVDVEVYGDYLCIVGRTAMMDLSTMVSNMKRCRQAIKRWEHRTGRGGRAVVRGRVYPSDGV